MSVREKLLQAAVGVFCQKGYDGGRIEEIVTISGVNVRMVYHYFGSKEGLYDESIRHVCGQVMTAVGKPDLDASDPFEAIELAYKRYCSICLEQPLYAKLLTWEGPNGWSSMTRVFKEEETIGSLFCRLVKTAKEAGCIDSELIVEMAAVQLASFPHVLCLSPAVPAYQALEQVPIEELVDASWKMTSRSLKV
jgi:AcrR family transcriptional regulator